MRSIDKAKSFLLLVFCTAMALFNGHAKAEEVGEAVETGAKASVLIESKTGAVLLRENENQAMPMASTTKVMTALMALEYGKLDDMVTVSRNAFGVPGTSIYLSQGERITLRDLVYGLMLASGNDAAVAIAEHLGGTVEAFCQRMTQRARELGCEKTVFVNPNGLPAPGHQTTAYELALIAREAMKHEEFRTIVSTQRASIPWEGRSYDRILNNKNRLLREYEGATGIKTGYTKAAGRCLVFGARRQGLEVIGVVLNCGDWFEEAKRIMDKGFATYEAFIAFEEGEMVRALPVEGGQQDTVAIYAQGGLSAPVRKGLRADLELELPDSLPAGMLPGTPVGEARLMLGERVVAQTPLVVGELVAEQDFGFTLDRMLRQWVSYQTLAQ
ncbi:MAG: D-alanyl-D-alanine carboxypeptidase family protein [Candidatus Limiplasma sp.]|nr:D-alanyl-D-alanine carboxypeptidase family protein [Candidatus Limiplasma sp.]